MDIRGEYWITDGQVYDADGNVNDHNHESIALDYIFSQYNDTIQNIAQEYDIEFEHSYEVDSEHITDILKQIFEVLEEKHDTNTANSILMQELGVDQELYSILFGFGDVYTYLMKNEGWIAVRGNNADLYDYQLNKKNLLDGLEEIIDIENYNHENEQDLEIAVSDHKTNKHYYVTLNDLKQPFVMRPQQWIRNQGDTRHSLGTLPDSEENRYSSQMYNPYISKQQLKQNPWKKSAVDNNVINPSQDLWRAKSESFSFKDFIDKIRNIG